MNIKLSFRIPARVTVLIFLILLMTGCGAALQSVEKDKEMGRETAKQVEVDMGIYPDAEGTRYLNRSRVLHDLHELAQPLENCCSSLFNH